MEGTIGEIRYFAGNFAPRNWAFCQGQLLPISQNTALFSILGTTYGGNGQTTFGLPDFQGRIAVGPGQGPGLSPYTLGQVGGSGTLTLQVSNLPQHLHAIGGSVSMNGNAGAGNAETGQSAYPATLTGTNMYSTTNNGAVGAMHDLKHNLALNVAGTQTPTPVNSNIPYLGMNFVICMFGIFPSRN